MFDKLTKSLKNKGLKEFLQIMVTTSGLDEAYDFKFGKYTVDGKVYDGVLWREKEVTKEDGEEKELGEGSTHL